MCQLLIHASRNQLNFAWARLSFCLGPLPRTNGDVIILGRPQTDGSLCQGCFSLFLPAGTAEAKDEGTHERLKPCAISLETWGHPAWAAACHCEKWHCCFFPSLDFQNQKMLLPGEDDVRTPVEGPMHTEKIEAVFNLLKTTSPSSWTNPSNKCRLLQRSNKDVCWDWYFLW